MSISPYNPLTSINQYVYVMGLLAEFDDGVKAVGEILEVFEDLP